MDTRELPRTISSRKRRAFSTIVFLTLYLFLEAFAYVGLRIADGRWYRWSSADTERSMWSFGGEPNRRRPSSISSSGVVHPFVGYVMQAGWQPAGADDLFSFVWTEEFTNRPCDGFPSRRPVVQKRSGSTIIVGIFGGSVAEVFYHQGVPTLLQKLREHPRYRGKEFVVVSLACGGYKQPQQLMALNYVLAQGGELDLLINIDGFNEVALHPAENQKLGVYPIYPRGWAARVGQIRDAETLSLYGRASILESDLRNWASFFSTAPMSFSPACHLLWRTRSRALEKSLRDVKQAIEASAADDESIRSGQGYRPASEQAMYDELVQLWEESSRQMNIICAGNQIRYYHFLQPNQYVEGSKPMGQTELKNAFRENHPYREGVEHGYPLLREAGERLAAAGERFADLTNAFDKTSDQIYFDDCCHFGIDGNQILANRIADVILSDARHE